MVWNDVEYEVMVGIENALVGIDKTLKEMMYRLRLKDEQK
jgi:hypothetical protein